MSPKLAERLALLHERGGVSAAAYWLLRQSTRVDLFQLLSISLDACSPPKIRSGCRLLTIRALADLAACEPSHLDMLDAHCGSGVLNTLHRGGRIYALIGTNGVLCQTTIETTLVRIDTPCDLEIALPAGSAFLSYLHTPVEARNAGWAKQLVAMVAAALQAEGLKHCYCHVQATNVRSLNTFSWLGWRRFGWLASTPSKRFLGTTVAPGYEISFRQP